MSYLWEQLDPETFQELCQVLLLDDFPNLQCFPLGQPDGGRDGLSPKADASGETVIAQIKFRRTDEIESAKWMIAALEGELPKISRLIGEGMGRYIIVTNANGTGHSKTGRIDKVQSWLDEHVAVPAQVFWRDDIDRRFARSKDSLKLRYPGILTGADASALIAAVLSSQEGARIERALRAFVADQFKEDLEVKFRQVELANSLLSLFVDIPLDVSTLFWKRDSRWSQVEMQELLQAKMNSTFEVDEVANEVHYIGHGPTAPAADLLLDSRFQNHVPWVLLNGAPGQGKSTLAQYVCQVHRARHLNKLEFLDQVPSHHGRGPFRLPIKLDLRDLDAYFSGRPFLGREPRSAQEPDTLEGFIAAMVSKLSGGLSFTVDDLLISFERLPALIFLDGLDEVAQVDARARVVTEVSRGMSRLREADTNIQVVVTTRPSLFGRAATFGKDFVSLELAPIAQDTIYEYAAKWMQVRALPEPRTQEISQILSEKLGMSHIRDLTKNPMQLAIFLSLIQAIGHSIPDARTDLYREYVNLFMTREAEKNAVVMKYRALLANLVEYLAWLLQSGAESDRASGSITEVELRAAVASYLDSGGWNASIVDELFEEGIERVWVLVQRVQGLYEFEVQPLREYFAAKYLYETAPHSSRRHKEVWGDRADRFEAMLKNPYWANVLRFYAGFYSSGEIGAISESLREMISSDDLALSLIARNVGMALLGDWIFKSKKFIQAEVIDLCFDRLGLSVLLEGRQRGVAGVIRLDEECGRDHLAARAFEYIRQASRPDGLLVRALAANGGQNLTADFASWIEQSTGAERSRRLRLALQADSLAGLPNLIELLTGDGASTEEVDERFTLVVRLRQDLLPGNPKLERYAFWALRRQGGIGFAAPSTELGYLAALLNHDSWRRAFTKTNSAPLVQSSIGPELSEALKTIGPFESVFGEHGRLQFDPVRWGEVLETLGTALGDCWGLYRSAALSVGLYDARYGAGKDIDESSASLLDQAAIARAWKGRASWWVERLESSNGERRLFWLGLLLAWAPSTHVRSLLPRIEQEVAALDEYDVNRLAELLRKARSQRRVRGGGQRAVIEHSSSWSDELSVLLFCAFGPDESLPDRLLVSRHVKQWWESKKSREVFRDFPGWSTVVGDDSIKKWLNELSVATISGALASLGRGESSPLYPRATMSLEVAEAVLEHEEPLPREVLRLAYQRLVSLHKVVPLQRFAEDEHWTFE